MLFQEIKISNNSSYNSRLRKFQKILFSGLNLSGLDRVTPIFNYPEIKVQTKQGNYRLLPGDAPDFPELEVQIKPDTVDISFPTPDLEIGLKNGVSDAVMKYKERMDKARLESPKDDSIRSANPLVQLFLENLNEPSEQRVRSKLRTETTMENKKPSRAGRLARADTGANNMKDSSRSTFKFQEIPPAEVLSISSVTGRGALRAFVQLRISDLIISDFRIVQEPGKRAWVSFPVLTYRDELGTQRYRQLITTDNKTLKNAISETVLTE